MKKTVCEDWHNFQNYASWYNANSKENCHVDKDLLKFENKHYSPDTCMFVPVEVNNFFINSKNKHSLGVVENEYGFVSCGKLFSTKQNATNHYWNNKYKLLEKLINKHNNFEDVLRAYFEKYFYKYYNIN